MAHVKNKKITRREFVKTGTAAAAAGVLLGDLTGFTRFVRASTKVSIGVIAPSHCALSMVYASMNDAFKKNGINAEIVYLPDMPDIARGLISGDLQVGQLISPVFFAMHAGSGPFKGKATPMVCAQTAGTNGGVLVKAKDSPIKMVTDLKGKNIGVHSPLMVHSLLFNTLLVRYKLNPRKDLNIKVIPMHDLIPALKKGEIDAFINPEPLATFSVLQGAGTEMMSTKSLWFQHPCCLVSMRKDFFDNNTELAKGIYASTMESGLYLNDPKTRFEAIAKVHRDSAIYNKVSLDGLKKAFIPGRSDFQPFIYQSSGKAVLSMMRDAGILPAAVDIDDVASRTLLSDLSRELLLSAGGNPPGQNSRQEKIVGQVFAS